MRFLTILLIGLVWSCGLNAAEGRSIYFAAIQAGAANGTSENNAYSIERLASELNHVSGTTTYVLAPGVYELNKPLKILAPDRGKIIIHGGKGTTIRAAGDSRYAFPLFIVGRGNFEIRDVSADGFESYLRTLDGSLVDDVAIDGVTITDVANGIVVGGESVGAHRWTLANMVIENYLEAGIRLSGPDVSFAAISTITIDGTLSGTRVADCYKAGIQIHNGAHDLSVSDFSVTNNVSACGDYPQGDGIEADDSEVAPYNIVLSRGTLSGNRDGDLDLKAKNVAIEDVRAQSSAGRYSLRAWNYEYACARCDFAGGQVADVFLNEATVHLAGSPPTRNTSVYCADGQQPDRLGQLVVEIANGEPRRMVCKGPEGIILGEKAE